MGRLGSFLFVLLVVFLLGCSEETCRDVPELEIQPPIAIERLDQELFSFENKEQVNQLLRDNPGFSRYFLDTDQYPSDQIVANKLFGLINDPFIDTLYKETQSSYGDLNWLAQDLADAFARMSDYYPHFQSPKVQTVITGLYKDLLITDSLVVIGLDHFLGAESKYKPLDVPDYILRRYDQQHMVPIIVSFMAGWFNQTNYADKTMLAEMVDYGKSFYFVSQILPCVEARLIIGYTAQEWQDANDNDGVIWANLIENELLYENDHVLKNKFLGERPNIFEIGDKCPGRIGRWVGWEIVKTYMEQNPDMTLTDLMAEKDANKIFQSSRYKPRN
ncbi:MAG: gliding motility lipoprotein GldB [Cyclobacteriaceae bacterium]